MEGPVRTVLEIEVRQGRFTEGLIIVILKQAMSDAKVDGRLPETRGRAASVRAECDSVLELGGPARRRPRPFSDATQFATKSQGTLLMRPILGVSNHGLDACEVVLRHSIWIEQVGE